MTIHNRFNPADGIDKIHWHSNRILQSAELNELQAATHHRIARLGATIHAEGDITSGAQCVRTALDEAQGTTTWLLEAGDLYLRGAVRSVPNATLQVPLAGVHTIGVYLQTATVTALQDPSLYNPAAGTRGYGLEGADREKVTLQWGREGGGVPGEFFAVYTIENGNLQARSTEQADDAIGKAIERYDIESAGGTYISNGLALMRRANTDAGHQLYNLTAGSARINGRRVDVATDQRIVYPATPDLQWVDSEPYSSTTAGQQTIQLNNGPAVGSVQVRIQARKTATVVHGGFAGVADPLPHQAVVLIESVTQGGQTYQQGVDWRLSAGQIDWSLDGQEPAPGSTYQVVYQCMEQVEPDAQTDSTVTITGALEGTMLYISYNFALRRFDRLLLGRDGKTSWQKGVSAIYAPVLPEVPDGYLSIASVYQSWDAQTRVEADGVRLVPMQTLHDFQSQLAKVFLDLAETRLAVDIAGRYSGIKKGLFADAMIDDTMRDGGTPQTAAIADGALQLDMDIDVYDLSKGTLSVPHNARAIISQPRITGSMRINPYDAFGILPTELTLTPSTMRWTEVDNSNRPRNLSVWGGFGWQQTSIVRTEMEYLRPIDIEIEFSGVPGETITSLTFDGLPLPVTYSQPHHNATADATGKIRGSISIPDNIPAGTKDVRVTGSGGSHGSATFVGSGTIERGVWQMVRVPYDPLAQTFTVDQLTQCCGVKFWATAVGSPITVQLRDVEGGIPGSRLLAQTVLQPAAVHTGGQATVASWSPVTLQPGQSYCVVLLCGDATSAVRIAELGGADITTGTWVTSQPYATGVLLSSSNNQSWTVHQSADLAFEVLAPEYTTTEQIHALGQITVTDCTDLLIRAEVIAPAAGANGTFVVVLDDLLVSNQSATYHIAAGQPLRLPQRYSGRVSISAKLQAAQGLAAVLADGITLLAGKLKTGGDYVSPWITADAGGTTELRVVFEANIPAGSSTAVQMQRTGSSDWETVPYLSSSQQTTGMLEITHRLQGIANAERLRVRLQLTGEHAARPQVRNLRAVVL